MDDININDINVYLKEVKVDPDMDEWMKLSWIKGKNDTNDEISDPQKCLCSEEILEIQTKDNSNEICTSSEPGDTSDGISVISESDREDVNINSFQTSQFYNETFKRCKRYIIDKIMKRNVACLAGITIGFLLHMMFVSMYMISSNQLLSKTSNNTLIIASDNIINSYQELIKVKAILSEIEVYTKAINNEIFIKDTLSQVLENINSNKINDKSIIESLDSNLNQLQLFLRALSPATKIDDINDFTINKMNKTLDIVNDIKAFYKILISFKNDTQNMNIVKFLQNTADTIHNTSELLFSNLLKKMNKITLNIYNKYTKMAHKLREKLCRLKNALPDNNEFLKQLTENNQLFENYDKSCLSNYSSKNWNDKIIMEEIQKYNKRDMKRENIKNQIRKFNNSVLYTKYNDTKIISKIHNDNSSLKSENNKEQNINNSTTKVLRNITDKMDYTSEILSKKVLPKYISNMTLNTNNECNNKRNLSNNEWCHLESIFDKELWELNKNNEKNNKNSINCETIKDILELLGIREVDILKNSFNNILIQEAHIPFYENKYSSKYNIDISTSDIISKNRTKDYVANSDKKHKTNIAESMIDFESFTQSLLTTEKNRKTKKLKNEDCLKLNVPTNIVFNNNNANIERNNFQRNTKQEEVISYRKLKSLYKKYKTQQNNQHYKKNLKKKKYFKRFFTEVPQNNLNWYFLRSNSRRNARNMNDAYMKTDWYFQRVRSRKDARKYMKYQQNTKNTEKKKKHS